MKYRVDWVETFICELEVEADNPDDAIEKANDLQASDAVSRKFYEADAWEAN